MMMFSFGDPFDTESRWIKAKASPLNIKKLNHHAQGFAVCHNTALYKIL